VHQSLKQLDLNQADQPRPKYERLKTYLLGQLESGRLKPGEALPSEVQLAGSLQVARNTVRQALALLEHDGLIERVRGKGTFIREDAKRRLRRGLEVFALVVPETRRGYYPSLLHAFETGCNRVQHQAIVCSTDNDVDRQGNIILQLMDKQVAGVAIVPTTDPPTPVYQVRQLQKQGIPVVFCHRRVEGIRAPLAAIPFEDVGRKAGRALLDHGHLRAALLATHASPVTDAYERGLRAAMRDGGGDLPADFVYYGTTTSPDLERQEAAVAEALRRMLRRPDRPTGIMASFDSLAELVYLLLGQMGLHVPQDVSLIGFGDAWREGAIVRRLTSVVVDEMALGRRAVTWLHQMRSGDRPLDDTEQSMMPLSLSRGATLGTAAQPASYPSDRLPG